MFTIPEQFLDQANQIVTNEPDIGNRQGDSFQRCAFVMIGQQLQYNNGLISINEYHNEVKSYVARLENLEGWYPGVYRRGSAKGTWSHSQLTMSRDQILSNIIALGLIGKTARGSRLFKILVSNLSRAMLFTTNIYPNKPAKWFQIKLPDLTLATVYAAYIRAFQKPILKPLLYLFDLSLLANAALITYRLAKNPEFSDELTFQASLIQSQLVMPTCISKLAARIYTKRPKAGPPHLGYKSDYGPQTALDQYFSYKAMSAPIDDLFRPTLQKTIQK